MSEIKELNVSALIETINYFKTSKGIKNIAIATIDKPLLTSSEVASLAAAGVIFIFQLGDWQSSSMDFNPVQCVSKTEAPKQIPSVDLIIAFDARYWDVYQKIGVDVSLRNAIMDRDTPVVPYSVKAWRYPMLPEPVLQGQDLQTYRYSDVIYQYISRSNLTGSYAEFGTWFGRSFFKAYCLFNEQFKGEFWAFDSFGGLPITRPEEAENTKGDFVEGRYFCNEGSFRSIASMTFPQDAAINNRIKTVKGFYDATLDGKTIADYGIKPHSISYCSIDCDLFDATLSVLRFIEPALQNGAIIYLDDYRMSRAAKEASLYHAVKVWLSENSGFELINLHQDHWQHQYVIFNRY
jgi:Macrocin-O-methyltransferase (TylF)